MDSVKKKKKVLEAPGEHPKNPILNNYPPPPQVVCCVQTAKSKK